MKSLPSLLVLIVALEHIYILILEMFLWTKPRTLKVFGLDRQFAEKTKSLAANQGLYNGFLSAGLLFGLLYEYPEAGIHIQIFFLGCVIVAAIYGSLTVKKTIFWIQGLPAICALLSLLYW